MQDVPTRWIRPRRRLRGGQLLLVVVCASQGWVWQNSLGVKLQLPRLVPFLTLAVSG